jgi:hypothetical protein
MGKNQNDWIFWVLGLGSAAIAVYYLLRETKVGQLLLAENLAREEGREGTLELLANPNARIDPRIKRYLEPPPY